MTDTEQDVDVADELEDKMTEQIEASFGPISVYVSGTNTEDVQDTFDQVWQQMMETSDTMHNRSDDEEEVPGRTFG